MAQPSKQQIICHAPSNIRCRLRDPAVTEGGPSDIPKRLLDHLAPSNISSQSQNQIRCFFRKVQHIPISGDRRPVVGRHVD
ncbi:hypothetical protein N7455_002069 [Penicillium solitum]|uniref:uncharacterized protein n=1 Tax=Penicillium solitum TaxID=60172 RepID=UPI0032C4AF1C|nr:hypothetical protein N7455_002069 [Penicillium solitum]